MPIVYQDTVRGRPREAFTIPATRREVLTEQFAQTFEENPIMATRRFLQLREDQRTGARLSAEQARARLRDAGMERDIQISDAGITEDALATLMERKRIEKRRQEIFARAQGGLSEVTARFGLAFATMLADPISAGLNFVPVVGQARYARWLAGARTMAGRVAVRAGTGAVEGAAGAALLEPFIYTMRTAEQADYDMVDSLMNVAFGGATGAGLHTTVGTTGELIGTALTERKIPRAPELSASDRVIERRLARRIAQNVQRAMEEYARLDGADGGRILNTDLARELSAEYRADRTRSAAVHEPASWLVKRMYERRLSEAPGPGQDNLVIFSAGGTGAGKTSGLELMGPAVSRAQIIYDTNMNGLKSAVAKIDQALEAGKEVRIVYTWRDPVDALVNGALTRAMRMGRTVPLDEHARTHVGAARTIKELAEHYAGDPRVSIDVIDNSHGRGKARLGEIADIPELDYNRVREDLRQALEAEYAAGRISDAVYRGTAGKSAADRAGNRAGDDRVPEPGDPAADRVAAASPEAQQAALRAAVGQAVTGQPINVEPILAADELLPTDVQRALFDQRLPDDIEQALFREAGEVLARDFEPTADAALKAAEEEASLAVADARSLVERLGLEFRDADLDAVNEAVARSERWARAAELATVCLVRGG